MCSGKETEHFQNFVGFPFALLWNVTLLATLTV